MFVCSGPIKRISNRHRPLMIIGLALLAVLLVTSPGWAVESQSGDQVIIGPDEVVDDDLYATASQVVVEGTVRGDLVAFGQSVTVDGTVEGDLIGAGQSVEIGGEVDDDVRIVGQALLLSEGASVGDDLIAAAYSLQNEPESNVGGTLWYAGYQALLAGTVGEDLAGAANALTEGGAAPPAFVPVPQVPIPTVEPGLTLTDSALIGGNLTYQSSTEAQIDPGARIEGDVVHEERPVEEEEEEAARSPLTETVLDALRSLVALVLVGLLLVWIAPGWIRRRAYTVLDRPLASLGWGLLGLVAFPILGVVVLLVTILLAIVLGLLTLGGLVALIIVLGLLAEAALVLALWISTGYLALIVVSFFAGVLLVEAIRPGRGRGRVLPLVVGLILYVVLRAIPVLGPLVSLAVVLLGLGAISHWIWTKLRRSRATAPPAG